MSDIFREVDEEVRREHYSALWKRFGPYLMGLALLIVLVVAGWRAWQWYEAERMARIGATYFSALDLASEKNHEDAAMAFAPLAEEGDTFGTLAALRRAAELAESGDTDGAVAAYEEIAADSGADRLLRNLADIRVGYLLVDTAEPDALRERMEGYLSDAESPWRNAAREIQGLAAYRAGDYDAASSFFEEILGDPEAPQDLLQRAEMMFTLLAAGAPDASADDLPPAAFPTEPATDGAAEPPAAEAPAQQEQTPAAATQGEAAATPSDGNATAPAPAPEAEAPAGSPAPEAPPANAASETSQ